MGRLSDRFRSPAVFFSFLQTLLAISLVLTLLEIRSVKLFLDLSPGQIIGYVQIFIASFAVISVYCLLNGFLFSLGCRSYEKISGGGLNRASRGLGLIYILEALVVDHQGFPMISRVYEGNIGEPTTLKEILEDLGFISKDGQAELPGLLPILVMDRGLATKKNMGFIRGGRLPNIIIEYQLYQQGDKRRWSIIREVLETHQRNTIIMTDDKDNIHLYPAVRPTGIRTSGYL